MKKRKPRKPRAAPPLAVSLRAGDNLLGARHGTAAALLRAGRLRAVPWGKRQRVLVADLERIAAEGLPDPGRPRRRPRARPPDTSTEARAVLAIDVDNLKGPP